MEIRKWSKLNEFGGNRLIVLKLLIMLILSIIAFGFEPIGFMITGWFTDPIQNRNKE
ncbi:MAG: hypothetical protein IPF63_10295 [Bacteroidetes bacterium]|nr:hypothetical protein [Bacteroidota bacterium]